MAKKRANLDAGWKSSGPLSAGEDSNIHREVLRVLGEEDGAEWLREPNVRFGGKTSEEIIRAGQEFWVRDVLRSYLHTGSS